MFMKNQIRAFILLLLPVFLLSACVSNGVQKESAGNKVKEISTYRGNSSLPPKHRTSTTVKLGRDLSLNEVSKDSNDVTKANKTVKITQAQFDELVKGVEAVDISKLKSKVYARPMVGRGSTSVTVVTGEGTYNFTQDGGQNFPPVIAELYKGLGSMMDN
jgi:hypothetical protein